MDITVRDYAPEDAAQAAQVWNRVVEDGVAFPQAETLTAPEADAFFRAQTATRVAADRADGTVVGLYILHPNNVGRCGHIANASYAVRADVRGQHVGEALVRDSLARAAEHGFRILQFNAVVASNAAAVHLYRKLGFQPLGRIPGGFHMKDGTWEDILPMYRLL